MLYPFHLTLNSVIDLFRLVEGVRANSVSSDSFNQPEMVCTDMEGLYGMVCTDR